MSGLMTEDSKQSLFLRSSSLFVNINGFVASTLARLCYFNQFDHEVEAVFVYNENETFITDFRATVDKRKIHREISELLSENEAERFYIQDQNDFIISVGKIPPNALVWLEIDVLGELQTTDNERALVFKTPEIFSPFSSEFSEASSITQTYKFDLQIQTDMPYQLAGCHSPSHAVQVNADANAMSADTVIITLAEKFKYDRQIKVHFYPAKPLDVYTSIEQGIGKTREIPSANPQTPFDYFGKSIQCKDAASKQESLGRTAKQEFQDALTNDNMTQKPDKFRTGERFACHSKTNSVLKDDSCSNEHFDKPSNNDKSFLKETKFSFFNSNSKIYQTDQPCHVLNNSVDAFLEKEDFNDIKEISRTFLRRNSSCQNDSNSSFMKDAFSNDLKNSTIITSTNRQNLQDNYQDIEKHVDFLDSSYNSTSSVNVEDPKTTFLRNSQTDDGRNAMEDTANTNHDRAENSKSKSTNYMRTKHFLSDCILAISFLPDLSNYSVCGEYIFMIDRSGSMNGSYICNAKESLVLFLKSLPTSSYFNVVSFGSYSRSLFPCTQRYTQDSLEKACVYVNSIKADMGGSELLQPLKAVLEKPHKTGYVRNVFVLTDGDIAQPEAILKYLKMKRQKSRIFTFGIGPKISYNIVCSIARNAQGKAYFSEQGSKIQTKVIQCLKDVLKPTLCDINVELQLPTNWELLRPIHEIPFSISGHRINIYASVEIPPKAQSWLGEKRKSSSVKEFWFDEELDSCQLGDNLFFDDLQDNSEFPGYWGTDTDISTSDCEQQYKEKDAADPIKDEIENSDNEVMSNVETDKSNVENIVKKWREVRQIRLYSSESSTETEDEGLVECGYEKNSSDHYNNFINNNTASPTEKECSKQNYVANHNDYQVNSYTTHEGLETSNNYVINKLPYVMDTSTDDSSAKSEEIIEEDVNISTRSTGISDSCDGSDKCNDVTRYNEMDDVIHNDVKYACLIDKQTDDSRRNDVYSRNFNEYNSSSTCINKRNKENVIDCDNLENISCNREKTNENIKESTTLTQENIGDEWATILLTGYVGPDIHREKIQLCLNVNRSSGISLHQMCAKKLIDGMENMLDSMPDRIEYEIATLSKETRISSSMTSSRTIDDEGNLIGVSQESLGLTFRQRKQQSRNSPRPKEDSTPAILVSCPSIDEESRSPMKRRLGISTESDPNSDDGKYYCIERLDPEGCAQVKRETRRTKLVNSRQIPVKAINRRKLVNTRLTLLTRKMKNAHKLNVFAGPAFIRLILLQSAEGFWQLTYAFARIIGLPLVQLELAAPFVDLTMIPLAEQDDRLGIDCYYDSLALWATALALVYLRRKWTSHEEHWVLIAVKAEAWLQCQTFPQGFGFTDVMLAAKQAIVLLEQKYRSRAQSEPVGLIE